MHHVSCYLPPSAWRHCVIYIEKCFTWIFKHKDFRETIKSASWCSACFQYNPFVHGKQARYDLCYREICVHVPMLRHILVIWCGARWSTRDNAECSHYLQLNFAIIFHDVKTNPTTDPACQFPCFTPTISNAPLLSSLFYSLAVRKVLSHILWYQRIYYVIYMNLMHAKFAMFASCSPKNVLGW